MSLKEIARQTGSSVATVSRVLNTPGYHCKDENLEQRIWACARELNYQPNHAARSLKCQALRDPEKSHVIDIFFARDYNLESDPFFGEVFEALRERLLSRGYHIGEIYTLPDLAAMAQRRMQRQTADVSERSQGIIILGKCPDDIARALNKHYHAVVGIDRNPTDFLYDEVFCNGTTAATMAMDYLISLGHRKIGYVGECSYEARYIGYYQSLMLNKISFDYAKILPSVQTREGGFQTMEHYLEQNRENRDRPTAFLCANDSLALGVLDALKKKRNYRPSIISIDNIRESADSAPMLTTIAIPSAQMAYQAVNLLLDRIDGGHSTIARVELPCTLVVRESCDYV